MPSKEELRRMMRGRLVLDPDWREEKSAQLRTHLCALPAWQAARTIALFAAQSREPDLDPLWHDIPRKHLAYPRTEGDGMAFFAIGSLDELVLSRWKLREPPPVHRIDPTAIDLIVIPGVAFSPTGGRCGRGGGFYDRFLATLPPSVPKIGVGFHFQIVPEVPMELHDARMDYVVTDQGVVDCR